MNRRFLKFTIRFPFQLQGLRAFEESDQLIRPEDWTDLNVAILFDESESLSGLEPEGLPNLFRDYNLVFG